MYETFKNKTKLYVPSTLTTSFMCHTFWDTDHIFGELDSWQVFDIHMIIVDDLCKLSSLHCLLKHPHPNLSVKLISLGQHIVSHNFGNCRTPATRKVVMVCLKHIFSILDSLSLSLSDKITHMINLSKSAIQFVKVYLTKWVLCLLIFHLDYKTVLKPFKFSNKNMCVIMQLMNDSIIHLQNSLIHIFLNAKISSLPKLWFIFNLPSILHWNEIILSKEMETWYLTY